MDESSPRILPGRFMSLNLGTLESSDWRLGTGAAGVGLPGEVATERVRRERHRPSCYSSPIKCSLLSYQRSKKELGVEICDYGRDFRELLGLRRNLPLGSTMSSLWLGFSALRVSRRPKDSRNPSQFTLECVLRALK